MSGTHDEALALHELAETCAELNFKRSLRSEADELTGIVATAVDRSAGLVGRTAATLAGCAAVRSEVSRTRATRARAVPPHHRTAPVDRLS